VRRLLITLLVAATAAGCGASQQSAAGGGEGRTVAQATTVEETKTVSGHGLEVTVPDDWEARLYLAHQATPILQAANFPLPPPVDDLPADPPLESLDEERIYIAVFDVGDARWGVPPETLPWTETTLPLTLEASHFTTPQGLEPPPSGSSLARRYLIVGERAYVLRVAFAAPTPSDSLLQAANDALSTLSLSAWLPSECPPTWPGPWTVCPEARWVQQVAEHAGYHVVDDTGSALVAQGGGWSFYVWATDESPGAFQTQPIGRIEGVDLYGDETRLAWAAQGFVFWLEAGPHGDSQSPPLAEMDSLVRASKEIPPPE
jgi:hypothetical protein